VYFLKLSQGTLYEALFSFYNSYGKPTATPLGFVISSRESINLKIYKGSRTCEEFLRNRPDVVINLTNNPKLFLIFAFKDIFSTDIDNIRFTDSMRVRAPKIAPENGIYGYIECRTEQIQEHDEHINVTLTIENIDIATPYITLEPFSRVYNHMIDIVVYLTKIEKLSDRDAVNRYMELLKYSLHIVRDYCSSELCREYLDMVRRILSRLRDHGKDITELESR